VSFSLVLVMVQAIYRRNHTMTKEVEVIVSYPAHVPIAFPSVMTRPNRERYSIIQIPLT